MKEVINTSKSVVDCVKQQTADMIQVTKDAKNAAKILSEYAKSMPDPGALILKCFKALK
jgi:hypothetical protein